MASRSDMEQTIPPAPVFVHTWILNEDHAIATWFEHPTPDTTSYVANCKCGWHVSSASAGLRNWNVDGHASDVLKGDLCRHCRATRATWNEVLCSDCASLTEDEIPDFERTGIHPRVPA